MAAVAHDAYSQVGGTYLAKQRAAALEEVVPSEAAAAA